MPRHRIREIAAVSGLSEATVDRVLHERGGVRPGNLAAVSAAIAELDRRQEIADSEVEGSTLEAVLVEDRFRGRLIADALNEVRPRLRPYVDHVAVWTVPAGRPDLAAAALAEVQSRRPLGLLVDLEDDPAVVAQTASLLRAGVPVVTVNRSFPPHTSLGHSGLDNRATGATAAYLIAQCQASGAFAVAHGRVVPHPEHERVAAFVATVKELRPGATVISVALDDEAEADLHECTGLYVADENAAGATSFPRVRDRLGQPATIVGHRDPDLLPEIATQVFDFALAVDWEAAVSEACRAILEHHRRGAAPVVVSASPPVVLTPYNVRL